MIKEVGNNSADYPKRLANESLIFDFMDEAKVKTKAESTGESDDPYLFMPVLYRKNKNKKDMFKEYIYHSYCPDHILTDAESEMIGVCFKEEPTIALPDKIKHLESHADQRGNSLQHIAKSMMLELFNSSMVGVMPDTNDDSQSFLSIYKSKTIPNNKTNSHGYYYIVVTEVYTTKKGEEKTQRVEYKLEDGQLFVTIFRQASDGGDWVKFEDRTPELPKHEKLKFIPLRIAKVRTPTLLGMAKTVKKGFQKSADYYGMVHKLGSGTVLLRTDKDVKSLEVGHESGIILEKDGNGEILQLKADGANVVKEAMTDLFDSAVSQGIRLVSESSRIESGEALYLRSANKQIKLQDIANVVSNELTEALRVCAMFEGAEPNEVSFKINVTLIEKPTDVKALEETRKGVLDGLVKHEDYLRELGRTKELSLDVDDEGNTDYDGYIEKVREQQKAVMDMVAE